MMAYLTVGKMYCFNTCCCFLVRYLWIRLRMCEGGEIKKSCYLQLCTEMIFTFQLLVKQIKYKGGHFSPRILMIKQNQPLLWNKCWSSRSREGSAVSQGLQQTELKSKNGVVADLTLLPGNASRAPCQSPQLPLPLSCTHPQGGRVRRNPSTADTELNWETERHPTGFIRRAVFNLKKTPCKCRDSSKELSYWFS